MKAKCKLQHARSYEKRRKPSVVAIDIGWRRPSPGESFQFEGSHILKVL